LHFVFIKESATWEDLYKSHTSTYYNNWDQRIKLIKTFFFWNVRAANMILTYFLMQRLHFYWQKYWV
jgi:hypothetical protein